MSGPLPFAGPCEIIGHRGFSSRAPENTLAAVELAIEAGADAVEFDIQVAVELVRRGTPTINLPVAVRYLSEAEGGISHFRPLRDNLRFAWMHSKLCTVGCVRWTLRKLWPFAARTG